MTFNFLWGHWGHCGHGIPEFFGHSYIFTTPVINRVRRHWILVGLPTAMANGSPSGFVFVGHVDE